eukprot:TRINITY_DN7114_c0_g1_i1.p1 TRINITY_DN7114_c0_g1~~TRINITY_DN7114_c0_g1_i1.p1  ORF type:complete len:358 (+),score=82.57 TRINITY_DN7114_c0_g1_i1:83-1156(+)
MLLLPAVVAGACPLVSWTEPKGLNYTTRFLSVLAGAAYDPSLVLGDCIGSHDHPCEASGITCADDGQRFSTPFPGPARGYVVSSEGLGLSGSGMLVLMVGGSYLVSFPGPNLHSLGDLESALSVGSATWPVLNVSLNSGLLTRYSEHYRCPLADVARKAAKRGSGLTLVGHSSGGAIAEIAAVDVWRTAGVRVEVVSFGAPKVAHDAFAAEYAKMPGAKVRVVCAEAPEALDFYGSGNVGDDPVTDLPLFFSHPQPPSRLLVSCPLWSEVDRMMYHRVATYVGALPRCPRAQAGGPLAWDCNATAALRKPAAALLSVAPAASRVCAAAALLLLLAPALLWRALAARRRADHEYECIA